MMETTTCPECGELSEVQDRHVLESTGGPMEHVKIMCVRRHWFLLPVATLAAAREATSSPHSATERDRAAQHLAQGHA